MNNNNKFLQSQQQRQNKLNFNALKKSEKKPIFLGIYMRVIVNKMFKKKI